MSSNSAKHRKSKPAPSRNANANAAARSRHRKPSPITVAIQTHPTRTAAAVTGAVLIAAAAPAATHWSGDVGVGQAAVLSHSNDPLALNADASTALADHHVSKDRRASHPAAKSAKAAPQIGRAPTATPAPKGKHHRKHHHHHHHYHHHHVAPPPPVYENPLRAITGLVPERIDQGVDFSGAGPIYPIGDAIVTNAQGNNSGWPGGGWITYRLTDGPAAGLYVYVAENVTPAVAVGQTVTPDTVIANMYEGYDGIETGWAMPSGFTAESQAPEAGGISGAGPFPTDIGVNFGELLQALGVPAANNRYDYPSGVLPAGYSTDWVGALR